MSVFGVVAGAPEPARYLSQAVAAPPDGWDEKWRQLYLHEMAAISEGLCPVHGTPLDPRPAPPRKIAGHCAACRRYWGASLDDEQVGWWLDHNPVTGWPAVVGAPDWVSAVDEDSRFTCWTTVPELPTWLSSPL